MISKANLGNGMKGGDGGGADEPNTSLPGSKGLRKPYEPAHVRRAEDERGSESAREGNRGAGMTILVSGHYLFNACG